MWWATRLTFHSQRILRHLTRLLLASDNYVEAKKTFCLYVQLVSKSRQTQAGDTTLQPAESDAIIDRRETAEIGETKNKKLSNGNENVEMPQAHESESDEDETFLAMLVFGIRMLCRWGNEDDVTEAKRLVAIARNIVGAGGVSNQTARANLLTARGIVAARLIDYGEYLVEECLAGIALMFTFVGYKNVTQKGGPHISRTRWIFFNEQLLSILPLRPHFGT
jgi:hypothetical protein